MTTRISFLALAILLDFGLGCCGRYRLPDEVPELRLSLPMC